MCKLRESEGKVPVTSPNAAAVDGTQTLDYVCSRPLTGENMEICLIIAEPPFLVRLEMT